MTTYDGPATVRQAGKEIEVECSYSFRPPTGTRLGEWQGRFTDASGPLEPDEADLVLPTGESGRIVLTNVNGMTRASGLFPGIGTATRLDRADVLDGDEAVSGDLADLPRLRLDHRPFADGLDDVRSVVADLLASRHGDRTEEPAELAETVRDPEGERIGSRFVTVGVRARDVRAKPLHLPLLHLGTRTLPRNAGNLRWYVALSGCFDPFFRFAPTGRPDLPRVRSGSSSSSGMSSSASHG